MSQTEFDYLGPYKIERTLGRGGMGTVYKGYHAKSGEPAAIKVIATGIANQMRFRRRFDAEIETLKRLKHPNIVQLVGYGEEQGLLFYSMEFVEGHSLHDHLRQHGKLPWQEVLQVGVETTSALKHAHDLGIIHRDLKPANLMLNTAGHVKLTDFGVSKLFGSKDMTAAGSVIGTADYMSPEQAEGKGVTARSDLYSLGGVLYTLLTGSAPFGGKSLPEVLYAVRYNPVPSLLERAPDVPKELAELVHQLLEKDAQKRPPTALVVGNRLKSLQQGMQRLSIQSAESAPQAAGNSVAVGTQLTSLDLSDVDDDELKLTGEEQSPVEAEDKPSAINETLQSGEPLGTHEQQTMVAPDGMAGESKEALAISMAEAESKVAKPDPADRTQRSSVPGREASGPSHFTPVSERDMRASTSGFLLPDEPSVDWLHYGSLAGIIVLLLASLGFGWWMLRPQSADSIYD